MTPRKKIKLVSIPGFPAPDPDPVLDAAVEAWNDEAENPDEIGDENDDPRGDEQP